MISQKVPQSFTDAVDAIEQELQASGYTPTADDTVVLITQSPSI